MNTDYYFWYNKIQKSEKKAWLILRNILYNKDFFKNNWINIIAKHFKICKKTLKKYLKTNFIKIKWSNEKRLFIYNKEEFRFLKDLDKIVCKYDHILEKTTIIKGKYYLNNLKEKW